MCVSVCVWTSRGAVPYISEGGHTRACMQDPRELQMNAWWAGSFSCEAIRGSARLFGIMAGYSDCEESRFVVF